MDKDFSDVLDGLIMVDFTQVDSRLLGKYMGEDKCRGYLKQHGIEVKAD